MEKKQTAVEWFYQRILAKDIKEVFEQAKQMEKEQIEDAYYMGDRYSCCGCYDSSTEQEATDYYNEVYLGIIKEQE
jgi:hypothetical protein